MGCCRYRSRRRWRLLRHSARRLDDAATVRAPWVHVVWHRRSDRDRGTSPRNLLSLGFDHGAGGHCNAESSPPPVRARSFEVCRRRLDPRITWKVVAALGQEDPTVAADRGAGSLPVCGLRHQQDRAVAQDDCDRGRRGDTVSPCVTREGAGLVARNLECRVVASVEPRGRAMARMSRSRARRTSQRRTIPSTPVRVPSTSAGTTQVQAGVSTWRLDGRQCGWACRSCRSLRHACSVLIRSNVGASGSFGSE